MQYHDIDDGFDVGDTISLVAAILLISGSLVIVYRLWRHRAKQIQQNQTTQQDQNHAQGKEPQQRVGHHGRYGHRAQENSVTALCRPGPSHMNMPVFPQLLQGDPENPNIKFMRAAHERWRKNFLNKTTVIAKDAKDAKDTKETDNEEGRIQFLPVHGPLNRSTSSDGLHDNPQSSLQCSRHVMAVRFCPMN
ncbi:hypothetical protein L596_000324 [Steinernema carpocapsae]|uniref:Uncharacterized protein n=1 Tax=Steinernema carpocapsae TaxID=34508 RepID=A0A4U8UI07_STECR|nr:hypothetical protein L596_000324 [Steinernema carpocapsae]